MNSSPPRGIDAIELVTLGEEHIDALGALRLANADDIRWTSPAQEPLEFTPEEVARALRYRIEAAAGGEIYPLVILRGGEVVGDISITHVIRRAQQSANIGVLVDRAARGHGIASTAIGLACRLAFEELSLHRLEAGIQPSNVASQRAFIRNGFERIGLARGFLFIDGVWRDHLLFQKLAA